MRLALYIARRYLLSGKLPGAINFITIISSVGIMFIVAALIIVLSVFNGFHVLIRDLYESFDPDLKITSVKGRYFSVSDTILNELKSIKGVAAITKSIEGRAVVRFLDKEKIVKLKGVEQNFTEVSEVMRTITGGDYEIKSDTNFSYIVLGTGVAFGLQARIGDWLNPMELFTLSGSKNLMTADPDKVINKKYAFPTGFFSIQKEYDEQYVLSDYKTAAELFENTGKYSSIEIAVKNPKEVHYIQDQIVQKMGQHYIVETWFEQHQTLYEVMKNEKAVGYLVLALMLLLTSCNIIGCLSMVVIEKRTDIGILLATGAPRKLILSIFIVEGLFIGLVSCIIGLFFGYIFCYLQAEIGLLKMNVDENSSFIIQYFPVEMQMTDFILVFGTVMLLSILSSVYPAYRAASASIIQNIKY